jgi:hypothetical protein
MLKAVNSRLGLETAQAERAAIHIGVQLEGSQAALANARQQLGALLVAADETAGALAEKDSSLRLMAQQVGVGGGARGEGGERRRARWRRRTAA